MHAMENVTLSLTVIILIYYLLQKVLNKTNKCLVITFFIINRFFVHSMKYHGRIKVSSRKGIKYDMVKKVAHKDRYLPSRSVRMR